MSKREKALQRLRSKPKDFNWNELKSLMEDLGFVLKTTSGSGRKFIHEEMRATHFIHEPHPSKTLKAYQVRDLITFLTTLGFIQ